MTLFLPDMALANESANSSISELKGMRIKSDAYHAPLYHEVKREVDPLPSSQRLQYFRALSFSSLEISPLIPGLSYYHNAGTKASPSRLTLD